MMHPVRHLAFWKTKEPEIREMIELYNDLAGNDPELQKKLDTLIAWAREERSIDDAFNNCEYP